LKAAISGAVTALITSPSLRAMRRRALGWRRRRSGGAAMLHYFHDASDPYSHLTAQLLPALARLYHVDIVPHLVGPPTMSAAPDAARLAGWSARDAALLARDRGLDMPETPQSPGAAAIALAQSVLAAMLAAGDFAEHAGGVGSIMWRGEAHTGLAGRPAASAEATLACVHEGDALRTQLGHYLGATFYFEGEWYWGVDRMHYLEQRLLHAGLGRAPAAGTLAPVRDVLLNGSRNAARGRVLHMFLSFRSPYSYIALPRARALAAHYGAELRLRFVLPMVMRGLPVPRAKRIYITLDTKREAERLGLPFGRIVDPVGAGVERGLAVLHHAITAGRGEAFALSFLQGVFAEGIDAASDSGLRLLSQRAGLELASVTAALADSSWRDVAEANRAEMLNGGLWGVPSFRVDYGPMVWGQDRLWVVEDALRAPPPGALSQTSGDR
jgi:2-hydroxychromene-2-carboxylate isomerase